MSLFNTHIHMHTSDSDSNKCLVFDLNCIIIKKFLEFAYKKKKKKLNQFLFNID